jgi:beta-galactosidase
VRPGADLSGYKLVLASALHVLPDALAEQLTAFVEAGGVLLADARTGVKDETNLAHPRTLPGLLSPALGIAIEEYESLGAVEYAVQAQGPLDGAFTATQYADWAIPDGAEVVAGYGTWPVEDFAAVTRNAHGAGHGWYVGTVMQEESFYDRLVAALLEDAGVSAVVDPPDGVEVSVREGEGRRLLFVINHTEGTRTVPVPEGKRELLAGVDTGVTLELEPYGVAVIRLN